MSCGAERPISLSCVPCHLPKRRKTSYFHFIITRALSGDPPSRNSRRGRCDVADLISGDTSFNGRELLEPATDSRWCNDMQNFRDKAVAIFTPLGSTTHNLKLFAERIATSARLERRVISWIRVKALVYSHLAPLGLFCCERPDAFHQRLYFPYGLFNACGLSPYFGALAEV